MRRRFLPMTDAELRDVVTRALKRIAPEADVAAVAGNADLREEIDIDSMDLLNFFVALHDQLKVDIAEADYGRLTTIDGCVKYLREKFS